VGNRSEIWRYGGWRKPWRIKAGTQKPKAVQVFMTIHVGYEYITYLYNMITELIGGKFNRTEDETISNSNKI